MQQVINVWLENKPGALMRVVGIISATGANIEQLMVSSDPQPADTATMTIVVEVEPRLRQSFIKRIDRLVNVLQVQDATELVEANAQAVLEWHRSRDATNPGAGTQAPHCLDKALLSVAMPRRAQRVQAAEV